MYRMISKELSYPIIYVNNADADESRIAFKRFCVMSLRRNAPPTIVKLFNECEPLYIFSAFYPSAH